MGRTPATASVLETSSVDAAPGLWLESRSPSMAETLHLAREVARTDTTVLITGETGTGKEVLARLVHDASPRAARPFVAINCGALPAPLIESELFGHERGAFSGAVERRLGYFEAAREGTLLLDEVSELPTELQTRLLRVLQEREVQRVGGSRTIPIDVRVIATTNRDLRAMVGRGELRKDLYYRLNVFPLRVPPLRDRPGDLEPLALTLIDRLAARMGRSAPLLTSAALERLARHPFPGNVRELANVLERALVLVGAAPGAAIEARHLMIDALGVGLELVPTPVHHGESGATLRDLERQRILRVLDACGGNRTHASRQLGISIRTLRNKLRDYRGRGIPVPAPPSSGG